MLYKSFQREEEKNPQIVFSFFFEGAGDQARIVKFAEIIFGQTKPHQESQLTATISVRSVAMSFGSSILC